MGFLDKLLGRVPRQQPQGHAPGAGGGSWTTTEGAAPQGQPFSPAGSEASGPESGEDARAVARYRYLLRTAPPEALEQVHAEAFGKLTPEQRQQVLSELTREAPQGEAPRSAEPQDLARAATRAEMRQPGTLERTFGRQGFGGGGMGGGMGMGGMLMGSMMGTIAGVVVGSAIANAMFDDYGSSPEAAEAGEAGADGGEAGGEAGGEGGDAGGDASGDAGGDAGGDFGGGDFGGGDFGGGDFGGGDFGGGF